MQLPNTTNAAYIYAFKKGYRMAMEGKPLSYMPSDIRHHEQMRQYFQMGWDQFQEELANGEKVAEQTPWRSRFAWTLMAIIAGMGTASLMIREMQPTPVVAVQTPAQASSNSNTTKTLEVAKIPSPAEAKGASNERPQPTDNKQNELRLLSKANQAPNQNHTLPSPTQTTAPQKPIIKSQPSTQPEAETLALLNPQARSDLKQLKQQSPQKHAQIALPPLVKSPIHIQQAILAEKVENRQPVHPLKSPVPKYIRQVYFFTRIQNAKGQTIYHRWRYQGQVMATIPLKIQSRDYRTWSSKRLSSGWAGQWTIEVLNSQKHPIYRHQFHYIQ